MKKLNLLPAAVCVLAMAATFQSCDKVKDQLTYDLPIQTGTVQISIPPTSDVSTSHVFGTGSVNYNIDSFIKASTNKALGVNSIRTVKLASCTVTLNSPLNNPDNNFQNLESAYSSFYSSGNSTPYQVDLASNPDVYSALLTLPVDPNVELKSYMNGNTFTYTLGGKLRKATTETLNCTVQFSFNINVRTL